MLSKFSVKKPYTVVVGIVLIIILGIVSFRDMTVDLLGSLTVEYQKSTHRSHKTCFFYVKFSVFIAVILCYCMV
jgi:hypothetical protein